MCIMNTLLTKRVRNKIMFDMNQRDCKGMVHMVKDGDTLYSISRMYHVPLSVILRANPYVDVYNLQAGMEVCVPMTGSMNGIMPGTMNGSMPGTMNGSMNESMPGMGWRPRPNQPSMPSDMMPEMGQRPRQSQQSMPSENMSGNNTDICENAQVYTVMPGESLGEVLEKYNLSMEQFLRCNDMNYVMLAPETQVMIPMGS